MIWQAGIIFGAVTSNGDTICSESYVDVSDNQFNPEPGFDNPDYVFPSLNSPIVARSDIIESYAPGWNGLWPSLEGGFINPEILRNLARQESYWVMRDNNDPVASPESPLPLEVVCRLIAINEIQTRDIVFAIYWVKNIGAENLRRCRFGLLVDPDMPALVGADFDDDDAVFIRDINLAYARDSDNLYLGRPVGYLGIKLLRSPRVEGQELGLTGWTTFGYADMPDSGKFYLSATGPDPTLGTFANRDHAQYGYMQPGLFMAPRLNNDVIFLMSSSQLELAAGDSVEIAVAFIAASDFDGLLNNAASAQATFEVLTSVNQSNQLGSPKTFAILQNYPNPFNPATTIRYAIPKPGYVSLKVFNLAGQEVAILVSEKKLAGTHEIRWSAGHLPAGMYVSRLQIGDFVKSQKLVLLK
jgi:hypothetical protein